LYSEDQGFDSRARSRRSIFERGSFNTLRTGDADLCFYIKTVQDG